MSNLKNMRVVITGASSGFGSVTAKLLVAQGCKVTLGAWREDRLEELVAELGDSSTYEVTDVKKKDDLDKLVQKSIDTFKRTSKGWLRADDKLIEEIKNEINKISNEKIIGISWKSNSSIFRANQRNIKLQDLIEPLKKLDIRFINLQYGNVSDEILNLRTEHNTDILEISNLDIFNDLDRLAALISACDCVVSVDNITPHLAGALGIDTRLLLPFVADERWGINSNKSYLYDSVKFYRQIDKGDWTLPLKELSQDLKNIYHA